MREIAMQRLALVDLGTQIRSDSANGTFEGLACRYGVKDSYGTTFEPGCFSAGSDLSVRYPFLAMHDPRVVLGTFTVEERDDGLWIKGEYDPDQTAQTYRMKAQSGSMPGLSVGFVRLVDPEDPNWESITHARLVEVSQITLGMQSVPGSELTAVRSAIRSDADAEDEAPAEDAPADEETPSDEKARCGDCGQFAADTHECPQVKRSNEDEARLLRLRVA